MTSPLSESELAKNVATAVNAAADAETGDVAEEKRAVDALKYLSKLVVTSDLLKKTDAGRKVSKLKKHSSSKVAEAALKVIDSWKNCVRVEATKDKPEVTKPAQQQTPALEKRNSSQSVPEVAPKAGDKLNTSSTNVSDNTAKKPAVVAAIQRKGSIGNKPQYKKPPAPSGSDPRYKIKEVIADALAQAMEGSDAADPDPWRVAVNVEGALFELCGGMTGDYKAKFRSISFNLKDAGNPWLRSSVLDGSITPDAFVRMTSEEMASEDRKRENERIREEMTAEAVRGQATQASTDMFKCSRCKQSKCTYFQMQTRSADEPMTTFVTCTVCTNKWKFC